MIELGTVPTPADPLAELTPATARLLASARDLEDDAWTSPSHCDGWSRAHVLAHVALNAEALTGVVRALADGRDAAMYTSSEDRDAAIEALAGEAPDVVRERLARACAEMSLALPRVAELPVGTGFARTPGAPLRDAAALPLMRLREVAIHHADLDHDHHWSDWPEGVARLFLDDDAARWDGAALTLVATDVDATWALGEPADDGDAPTLSGPVAALAWWATGRDAGAVLSSSTGTVPTI